MDKQKSPDAGSTRHLTKQIKKAKMPAALDDYTAVQSLFFYCEQISDIKIDY